MMVNGCLTLPLILDTQTLHLSRGPQPVTCGRTDIRFGTVYSTNKFLFTEWMKGF